MSCARPILAANARALPELVQHGVNGYLFNPQDATSLAASIDLFLNRPDQWAAMGQASLMRARPHQLDLTIQRYVEWYESVRQRVPAARLRSSESEQVRV